MDGSEKFINWYCLQYFPTFSEDTLAATSHALAAGYQQARKDILALPGAKSNRTSLAMLSIVDGMEKYGLDLDTACLLMLNLNRILRPESFR